MGRILTWTLLRGTANGDHFRGVTARAASRGVMPVTTWRREGDERGTWRTCIVI